jgi:ABC-type glutathione transport system ATPase component
MLTSEGLNAKIFQDFEPHPSVLQTSVQIEAYQLSKTYKVLKVGNQKAPEEKVRDVNFSIFENEVMGILGPSGAGKSSIFKMMTMAMSRSSG